MILNSRGLLPTAVRMAEHKDFNIGPISLQELPYFKWLVQTYVSSFYPETEDTYTQTLAAPDADRARSWRSTVNRTVWSIRRKASPLGFFVASEKPSQNVKLGPIVISPEFRRSGFGSRVVTALAMHYSRLGHRKLYMTIPASNFAACAFAIKAGFLSEARLKQHYSSSHDEWVFAKCLDGYNYPALPKPRFGEPLGGYFDNVVTGDTRPFHKRMLEAFVANLVERDSCGMSDPSERSCRIFHTDIPRKQASIMSSPKRGGAVKLEIISGTPPGVLNLLDEVEDLYLDKMRKMYVLLSASDTALQAAFVAKNYSSEGRLVQPDKKDLVVLSKLRR
jgi:ribosomal protein S18 acetylase RimI-like enzyme